MAGSKRKPIREDTHLHTARGRLFMFYYSTRPVQATLRSATDSARINSLTVALRSLIRSIFGRGWLSNILKH